MPFVKKKLSNLALLAVLVVGSITSSLFSPMAHAQQNSPYPQGMEPREAIGGILMSGLVGGILGLSTLSFYDRPQDNIRNITIGAGIGMIASALYLTYSVSQVPPPKAQFEIKENSGTSWAVYPSYNYEDSTTGLGLRVQF